MKEKAHNEEILLQPPFPRLLALSIACSMAVAPTAYAQAPRFGYLLDAEFRHEFAGTVSVRELADGSVIASDRQDRIIYHLAGPAAAARPLVRKGSGPGEVMSVSALIGGRSDSTTMYDSALRRALVLVGARVARTLALEDAPWYGVFDRPLARDTRGFWYGLRAKASTARKGPLNPGALSVYAADSAELVAISSAGGATRVLMTTRGAYTPSRMVVKTIAGVTSYYQLSALLDRPDAVAVCPDGRVLLAQPEPGRISWWQDGKLRPANLRPITRQQVTTRLKRHAIEESQGAENARHFAESEYPAWPKLMPAFERDGAWCLPDGGAIVEGSADEAGKRAHYHVSGGGEVTLLQDVPVNARIVGVGARGVYMATETDEGMVTVRRYRLERR